MKKQMTRVLGGSLGSTSGSNKDVILLLKEKILKALNDDPRGIDKASKIINKLIQRK